MAEELDGKVTELRKYSEKCYGIAKSKGFWSEPCSSCLGQGRVGNGTKILQCPGCDQGEVPKERNVGELLMLIVSEAGEAMEAHRKTRFADGDAYVELRKTLENEPYPAKPVLKELFESKIKDTFEDEIADVFIRLFDMCGGMGIDVQFFIDAKLEYNALREKRHGKAY